MEQMENISAGVALNAWQRFWPDRKKKKNDKEVAVTQGEGEPRVGRSLEKDRE